MTARPHWALLVALFVVVSLAVYGIARWQPFEPEAPAVAGAPAGDAARGEDVFARACAACHGTAGEDGGAGPALTDTGITAAEAAAVVAAGRGSMPAGIVEGDEAADVAAYVAQISGAGAAAAPAPEASGGRAIVTGPRLAGLEVTLAEAAPADWTVWLEGTEGRLVAGAIPAGATGSRTPSADGGRTLIGRFDRVLVGRDPAAPALVGSLSPERAEELLLLLVDDPALAGDASELDAAEAQVDVLAEHIRFLAAARDEGNLPNVRFHGEHTVNISRGEPLQDVDGNSDPSNPGDGVGLIDGPLAHLPRIATLAGPEAQATAAEARALVARIARLGALAGGSESVEEAVPAIAAAEAADARLADAWSRVRARAERAAVIELERP